MTNSASTPPSSPHDSQDLSLLGYPVVALSADSTVSFAEDVLALYASKRLFAIVRDGMDAEALLDGLEITHQHAANPISQGWIAPVYTPSDSDAPAQIVFTSGTEGAPKAIVLSHSNLANVIERLNKVMALTREVREYIGVPVTYSFGLGRLRAVGAVGGQAFIPEQFDIAEIGRMLAAGEINAISAVPSQWRMVLTAPGETRTYGANLRWIEIGSQHMSKDEKASLAALFPNARIVQHYGLTEASRSTFLIVSKGGAEPEEELAAVGVLDQSIEVKITEANAIAVRGPHVALGQLEAGKIISLTDADGWLITSDRGQIKNGRLYYEGRLDDQINVAGIKLAAEAFEREIATLVPDLDGQFAVTALPDALRGELVLLALEESLGDRAGMIEAAARICLERHNISPASALRIRRVKRLPKTGTGKIQRKSILGLINEDSTAQSNPPLPDAADLTGPQEQVNTLWASVLGQGVQTSDQTFYDIGGDSLSAVQIGLAMEGADIKQASVRATMEGRSLAEVAQVAFSISALPKQEATLPEAAILGWAVNLLRGFMVFWVLMNHWGPGLFARLGMETIENWLAIFIRIGTPGFATVFGIGIGLFLLPNYQTNRVAVLKRFRSSFWLVFAGMVLLALFHILENGGGWLNVSNAFFNVLAYYALALLSAPLWMPLLNRIKGSIASVLYLSFGLWAISQALTALITQEQQNSLIEWVRLMGTAKYNVFDMSHLALGGVAIGLYIHERDDVTTTSRHLVAFGGVATLALLAATVQSVGGTVYMSRWSPIFDDLLSHLMYWSLTAALLGLCLKVLIRWPTLNALSRKLVELLIAFGGLALPVYVFHGIVIPCKNVLVALGIEPAIALALPMGLFLGMLTYGIYRLRRMYFS